MMNTRQREEAKTVRSFNIARDIVRSHSLRIAVWNAVNEYYSLCNSLLECKRVKERVVA